MRELPDPLRREVLVEVYRQAADLDWDGMSPSQRSALYNRWIDDPHVGGQLSRYMDRNKSATGSKTSRSRSTPEQNSESAHTLHMSASG